MKYDKFFILAKEAGLEESELYINQSYSLETTLFHGEVDKYSLANGFSILARGKFNGKMGTASCDVWNADKAAFLVNEIKKNAGVIESEDPTFIFKGSEKYKKINSYNKGLELISDKEKLDALIKLEKAIKAADKRVSEAEVSFEESRGSTILMNSYGLKLVKKSNYIVYFGQAVVKDDKQTKSSYSIFLDNDFSKFDPEKLAKTIVSEAVAQLGGEACESATYKAVLSRDVVVNLMGFYVAQADAEEVQKNSSLFIGKLNEKVASNKVTIEDKPLQKSVFASWFDDEGVATNNKAIIKNGKLMTYLYNLTTAAKAGVESTGNAVRMGGKMGIAPAFLALKPGKLSLEEMVDKVHDGVYITDVSGLHAGLNPQSGNFSLQSTGFLIKDGKIDRGLDLITVSGNLVDLFKSITDVGNDVKVFPQSASCPSVIISKIVVSGK